MTDYDVLVVGAGIGGMESALKLGDMGYRVLLVEKEASVGGKMILLSKVFPTLDCASCISTPEDGGLDPPPQRHDHDLHRGRGHRAPRRRPLRCHHQAEGALRGRGCLHRLSEVRDGLHGLRARPVQRRPGGSPRRLHRLPAGGPQEGRHRARRLVPLLVHLPGRHPGPRLRLAHSQRRVREGLPTGARGDTAGGHARACLLRTLRGRLLAHKLEGTVPIRRLKRFIADEHYAHDDGPGHHHGRAQWASGRHRRLGTGRPDRRLAAGTQGLRREDLRGRARSRRLPAPGHPRVSAAHRCRRARHRQRHRSGRRDRGERSRRRPAALHDDGYEAVLVATGTPLSTGLGLPARSSMGSSAGPASCAR